MRFRRLAASVVFLSGLAILAPAQTTTQAAAQPVAQPAVEFDKYEYMIPMRDGARLYTCAYVPRTGPVGPILLQRTPYSCAPYGTAKRTRMPGSPQMLQAGYIFAFQDVRGKYMSEGAFENVRPLAAAGTASPDESTDTYDTVDWMVKHVPRNNGRVGLWGISYPGFYAGIGGVNNHPALRAISPQAPVSDWFLGDDVHHNGALFLQDTFNFFRGFGQARPQPNPNGGIAPPPMDRGTSGPYDFFLQAGALPNLNTRYLKDTVPFWNDVMAHGEYDDYWRSRSLPAHFNNVKCAVLTVGGWYDAEDMWGALNLYVNSERKNPGTYNALVMGPWFHGMWASGTGRTFGDLDFGSDTSVYFRDKIEFPFFERYLRDQRTSPPAEATVFETGANVWHQLAAWPPRGIRATPLYLYADGRLARDPASVSFSTSYRYDPAAPTPYLANPATSSRTREYMVDNQDFMLARSDRALFKSEPLTRDFTLAGPIDADLYVGTSGTDADLIVKVVDIYPADETAMSPRGPSMANYARLIRWEVMRGKFRDSFGDPRPFISNRPTQVKFRLNDLYHTFRKGHRMAVIVQSAMFPLVDRNPNQFVDIYRAKDTDFIPATIRIFQGPRTPSRLILPVLGKELADASTPESHREPRRDPEFARYDWSWVHKPRR